MTLQERREQIERAFTQVQQDLARLVERHHQLAGALLLLRELEAEEEEPPRAT